ncbi:LysR family transcriptional regulator [Saccharospirillum impatiens]|uniref:LysR family transcriptional regulator n=1 Tax=Saccharospirillum impatiens TaxID=169438 RepID=UPI0004125A3C|nr:LysR family transcriptional regulator [Saccharospirillum impatiens]
MKWTHLTFDWNQAKAFYIVASEGSFSAAARALNTTQPTLGRQVRALEAALSVTLFERVGRGVALTASGQALFEQVRPMGEAASQFSMAAQGQTQIDEGDVSVSVTELDAIYRLPGMLAKLKREAPNIRVELIVSNQISDLKKREADIAIRYQRPEQEDLIIRKIDTERVRLYGSQCLVDQYGQQAPDETTDLKLIGFGKGDPLLNFYQEQGWDVSESDISLYCQSQIAQIELVRQGLGLALLPDHVGDILEGVSRAFPNHLEPVEVDAWLVCHRELRTSRPIRKVFDAIVAHFTHEQGR